MNGLLFYIVLAPVAFGLVTFFLRRSALMLTFIVCLFEFALSLYLFRAGPVSESFSVSYLGARMALRSDALSSLCVMAVSFFALVVVIYSFGYFGAKKNIGEYCGNVLLGLGASLGILLSANFVILITFWGLSGLALYNLINLGKGASQAAKKTLTIVGGADSLMILGAALVWKYCGTLELSSIRLTLDSALPVIAYLCFMTAAFAKAGVMPLHSWITDSSEVTPAPVMALMPASIDKVIGIYLLSRMSLDLFKVETYSFVSLVLLIIGSLTIIFAVFSALLQHDLRKLLSFHAVSQVGYMVLGIGTGTAVGVLGAIFHMVNNAIYKSCLFLGAGAVEKKAGSLDLDNIGGLVRVMPITFSSITIAALAISGIPPLNGFASKWMIYQAVISIGVSRGGLLWIFWLLAAMFGSAVTLASFMKVLNAVFFGYPRSPVRVREDVASSMWLPMVLLASLCVIFGVFALSVPLKLLITPILPNVSYGGVWNPPIATIMLLIGLMVGFGIYLFGAFKNIRTSAPFTGGELISKEKLSQSSVNFYDTIKDRWLIKWLYSRSEGRAFDLFEQLRSFALSVSESLRMVQDGLLHTYLAWALLGLAVFIFVVFRSL